MVLAATQPHVVDLVAQYRKLSEARELIAVLDATGAQARLERLRVMYLRYVESRALADYEAYRAEFWLLQNDLEAQWSLNRV